MKKIALLVLLLAVSIATSAQFKFGVKGGISMVAFSDEKIVGSDASGSIVYENSEPMSTIMRGQLGGFANYSFNEHWAMQAEILTSYHVSGGCPSIDVPLLADFKPLKEIPLSILAGGQLAFWNYGDTHSPEWKTEYSLSLGVQYTFFKHLNLELRCNHGLSNTIDDNRSYLTNTTKISGAKTRVLQLNVGWTF